MVRNSSRLAERLSYRVWMRRSYNNKLLNVESRREKARAHSSPPEPARRRRCAGRGATGMQDWHLQDSSKHLASRREGTVITSRLPSSGKIAHFSPRLNNSETEQFSKRRFFPSSSLNPNCFQPLSVETMIILEPVATIRAQLGKSCSLSWIPSAKAAPINKKHMHGFPAKAAYETRNEAQAVWSLLCTLPPEASTLRTLVVF
ncbi:uncharacterized protein LOC131371015 [Hemibagrus wyckioides]|uniref:uncharacterized protein LOC131371015 n=1 Tax=Hemibagrus wyckioides TaxID=337641 RepID=UPI00266B612E|nr:uncharacterized protein LOC131371015 [Hemibagrus wyckioides]